MRHVVRATRVFQHIVSILARVGAIALFVFGCAGESQLVDDEATQRTARPVDDARLRDADGDRANWLSHGRTYAEQRFSPLAEIHTDNVSELGLAWSFDMETTRGVEATPLVHDGVVYVSGPWSVVYALAATTGELLWKWDPRTPRLQARRTCCGVVNRGVALYDGMVFVGTLEGRLVALDAVTGSVVWDVLTVDPNQPYTITGAPRVVAGNVIIGNGGAEYGVRGYVSAYDAHSGELAWRTYTVPGDPSLPFESKAMEAAAETWTGEWWKIGGGGTAWDSMAYDPDLDLLYIGTGNGSPHARWLRSPEGGDNLYLSSILALRPSTGELVWHFQTTPADTWDYTSTQPIVLADLEIDGRSRKVLMQAPKNGFFWVIDRVTGEFISAEPFCKVTWATGVDAKGRPIENPEVSYRDTGHTVHPGPFGCHNWHPMAFNPNTGLVYIPVQELSSFFQVDKNFVYKPESLNTGLDYSSFVEFAADTPFEIEAYLLAWDPVRQREVWRVPHVTAYNGGTLATAGGLVFQGTADGRFVAYRATNGEKLWESPAGTGVMAAPVTYTVDGVQYVTVAAGWGSGFSLSAGPAAVKAGVRGAGRVLTFALGRSEPVPPGPPPLGPLPPPTFQVEASAADIVSGKSLYVRECMACHGPAAIGGGSIADLRYSTAKTHEVFNDIVLGGIRLDRGMPPFADRLSPDQARQLQAYILNVAAEAAGSRPAP